MCHGDSEKRKREITEREELFNQESIRTFGEKENNRYLGILEADTSKQTERKGKGRTKYYRRTRKLFKTKLSSRDLIKGIND